MKYGPGKCFLFVLVSFANGSRIVVQFEDFKNPFPALEKYQYKYSCFNDDIQGTGAVVLAGIISALKSSGLEAKDQRAVFMGAGSAGTGVAKQIVEYYMKEGLTEDEARKSFWFVDTKVNEMYCYYVVNFLTVIRA
jgi:malate dehydrogenase (oxaloacetate-decarboxylating)(NADP+)